MPSFIETLLALNGGNLPPLPDPAKPMPFPVRTAPPPSTIMPPGPPPEAAPVAPLPALDMNFVNQYAGPAPTAPTIRQPGTLEKIAAILSGIGAGPEYGLALREERQRPIREYNAALERYQNRRTQGLEIATNKQQREQDRATRQAEQQAEREFQQWARRANLTDEMALLQARQAFELNKQRERERAEDEIQERKERAEMEKQRRAIESDLAAKDGAPPNIAKEISEYRVGLRPALSTAAQKWQGARARKLEAQLARVGGGSGGGGQIMAVLQGGAVVPASLVNKETGGVMLGGQSVPVVQYVGGNIPRQAQGAPTPTDVRGQSPEGFPLALGTPGGPQASSPAKPKLTNQQRARFNSIKREQPGFSDEEILQYMQVKGWL